MSDGGYVQAGIQVQQQREFGELKAAIERALAAGVAERFLKQVKSHGLRVRQFEAVLGERVLESVEAGLPPGTSAEALYRALTVSDQAQMREFYLTAVEAIAAPLRAKYHTQFETF